jgi:hypothetical protein
VALALLFAWAVAPALAQTVPPLNGVVSDDTSRLSDADIAAINEAARPLQDLGIKPLVVLANNLTGNDDDAYARSVADAYGLADASASTVDADLLCDLQSPARNCAVRRQIGSGHGESAGWSGRGRRYTDPVPDSESAERRLY